MRRALRIPAVILFLIVLYVGSDYVGSIGNVVITESAYNRLQTGMTYDQVTDIIGDDGYRLSSEVDFFGTREVLRYSTPYSPLTTADIYLTFLNGELIRMELDGSF